MIELRHLGDTALELAFGGDTLNTSIYLTRVAGERIAVDYATALGDDPYSDAMLGFFRGEGLGCDSIARLPGKLPGLYAIRTDARGERTFYYWRREAAARAMFDGDAGAVLAAGLTRYRWIYFSGITLSILSAAARLKLFGVLAMARRGGAHIVFDTNFRARGWPDRNEARETITTALRHADIAIPTFPDERDLFGDAAPVDTIARLRDLGVAEIIVKNGAEPVQAWTAKESLTVPAPPVARVVDTSAAGDAFNAAYLAARIARRDMRAAILEGHHLAGCVIGHRGAVIPRDAMPTR
jgi:2-dehydro-3-deoxygluconokinase